MDISEVRFASRFDQVTGSAIREIFKVIAQPGMISFAGGNPSLEALPDQQVSELAQYVLAHDGKAILQYGATEGYPPFVESLKSYVADQLGVSVPAVLPVTGSTQAMDLLCKALLDPGDTVLVENPSFLGNLQCLKLYQANLVTVESDEDGLIPDDLELKIKKHHPKLLYTIPTFQNPTGKTLPDSRRRAVADLANRYGMVVAEDDPYRDLRYEGEKVRAIKSYDQNGWVMFLGSFSKTISPGLRIGYIAGDAGIIRKCTIGKQSTDVHSANLNQAVVDQYLRRNLLPDHIRSICKGYGAKMHQMLQYLEQFPDGVSFTRPQGGLFIWAELPVHIDTVKLLSKAVERKVAYVPGTYFCADGGHLNTLRLNFSNSTPQQIETGMSILNDLIKSEI
ncbi:PLP-dependent aminotransferase family protein [Aristaeella hokkaidonensis]|uniref:PLP-dependent aminotransferase family protein n=1 Tax=Aristaeella hokkaidonensis TaxID=3046382 RepID=A0AC61N2M5_9FIRM|nr:PLP-dependent aminotransferase family protein [Aristaeella hokkaidonensis]QUC67979.1 PLP-dependent aminotransferase family protein [Aristaeella hokkaidonensis]SNT93049.1 2-aminoadipate transaminase [Aristaeella hokkaidonensis]